MSYFLAKTDPETYSIDDLAKDKQTVWDGVTNPQALQAIRKMQPGDNVLIYHSQGQSAIVGLARVTSAARPDPKNEKSWVVDLEFERKLAAPVTLNEVKSTGKFNDFSLVKQSRLSTMAVPDDFVAWLHEKGAL